MEDDAPALVSQDASDLIAEVESVGVAANAAPPRVPVTLITGFLGSGKVRLYPQFVSINV